MERNEVSKMANFMEAKTEISAIIDGMENDKSNIAKILAKAVVSRSKEGKVDKNLANDIDKTLNGLAIEDKYKVMLLVTYYLANSADYSNVSTNRGGKRSSRSGVDAFLNDIAERDVFSDRGY